MATHAGAGSQDLTDGAAELTGKGLAAHLAGNINNLIQGQVTVMLNVLFLLTITRGLLQGLDDHAGSAGLHLKGGNTVGNSELNTDTEALVVKSGLGNIILDLLSGDTEGTNLLGQSGTSTFTTNSTDEN